MAGKGHVTRVWVASVNVADLDRSIRFYRDVLGLTLRIENRTFGWAELGPEEPLCKIGLSLTKNPTSNPDARNATGIVLDVDDMNSFVDRLREANVRITRSPVRGPWGGLVADFLDPDGNELEVVFDPEHYLREDRR